MTFGHLRAQQISAIIFQCSMLYHTEFDFLWFFILLRPRMPSNTLYYWLIFLFFQWNIIWTCSVEAVTSLSVAFISFFNQSSHKFLPIFFSVIDFIKYKVGSQCAFKRRGAFISLSRLVCVKSLTFRTRGDDEKFLRSRKCAMQN